MVEYNIANFKLSDSQLNKLKTRITLRMNIKMFTENNLP